MPSTTTTSPRIRIDVLLDEAGRRAALHDATSRSLRESPKELPAIWLYDERGSQLFDEITRLPEYYLTGCEREILLARAGEVAQRTAAVTLVELGSGTSDKTRLLLDALREAGTLGRFVPLDVSEEVLGASAYAVAAEYPGVRIHAIVGDFERHLGGLPDGERRMIAFLGSTIGNLPRPRRLRLLESIAEKLGPDDWFLLGVDLVKATDRLEAAYNDPHGVTEAFVRNGLVALNRELGADFDQHRLDFVARWDAANEWMDIGFTARTRHVVSIPELEMVLPLAAGESLRFEISTKFRRDRLEHELATAGLRLDRWWTDRMGDFALLLAQRCSPSEEASLSEGVRGTPHARR